MIKSLGIALMLFFIQPLFWVGLLAAWSSADKRLAYERKMLRVAVYKEHEEVKEYLTKGLVIGLIISLVFFFTGAGLPVEFILLYQLITLLFFLFGYRFLQPIFTFSVTMLALVGYYLFMPENPISLTIGDLSLFQASASVRPEFIGSVLLITGILTLATSIQLMRTKKTRLSPYFSKSKRGKTIASYSMKPLWLLPILLVLPGMTVKNILPWWPVFSVGDSTYTFFMFPVLFGLQYTIKTQLSKDAMFKIGQDSLFVAVFAIIASFVSRRNPMLGTISFLLIILFGGLVLYRHRMRERKWHFFYAPNEEGWKVVGVRPGTPGEKMDVLPGDTILSCNQVTKEQTEDFYDALAANRVYCKLRIKRADGQIRLAETAIYDDASHDLGIIVVEDAPALG